MGRIPAVRPSTFIAGLLLFSLAAGTTLSAAEIDVSKLKPGDKLEAQIAGEWMPVELVEVLSDRSVKIRRPDVDFPMPHQVAFLRFPTKAAGKSSANTDSRKAKPRALAGDDASNPFATDEEKAAQAKPRTWTSRDGKFKVTARMLRVDGDSLVLRRDDDKEIRVPISSLSEEDQELVTGEKPADGKASDKNPSDDQKVPALTPVNLNRADQIDLTLEDTWSYRPDAAATAEKLPTRKVVLQRGSVHSHGMAARLIPLNSENKAFFVNWDRSPGQDLPVSQVQACDLRSGKVAAAGVFGTGIGPVDISPDGTLVLARSDGGHGFGKQAELRIYDRKGNQVEPRLAWLPYGHHVSPHANHAASANAQKQSATNNGRPELTHDADIEEALFADAKHVLSLSQKGEFAVWELPSLQPLCMATEIRGCNLAVSPGRNYVALPFAQGVALVHLPEGKVAGVLPGASEHHSQKQLAFRGDGKRLALVEGRSRVRVWDLESRELVRDFAADIGTVFGQGTIGWTGDDYLLVNGTCIDVSRRVAIWKAGNLNSAWLVQNGQVWNVNRGLGPNDQVLNSVIVPPPEAIKAVAGKSAEDLLVIRPGMEISVELPAGGPDQESTRQQVLARLQENGMKVVPQSNVRLVGTIQQGETKAVQYRTMGVAAFRTPVTTQNLTEQLLSLSLIVGNETVWKYATKSSPRMFVHRKNNETIEQAIQNSMQLDPKAFAHIWVPAYVARNPAAATQQAAAGPGGPGR